MSKPFEPELVSDHTAEHDDAIDLLKEVLAANEADEAVNGVIVITLRRGGCINLRLSQTMDAARQIGLLELAKQERLDHWMRNEA